jgi:hypothetical protein
MCFFSPFGLPGKAYEIEEDPDVRASFPFFFIPIRCSHSPHFSQWEAYDLGRAPEPASSADLSRTDHGAAAANLELARGVGSRYLVQRWGDGTTCDRTGKRREIEVQVGLLVTKHVSLVSCLRISVHVVRPSSTAP